MSYKYLTDGHKVRVVEVVGEHTIIARQYREWEAVGYGPDDYDELAVDIEGEPHCVLSTQLHDKPPTAVLEDNYKFKQEQLQEANEEYTEISAKVRELQSVERESKRIYDKLSARYEVLKNLEHFMDHGIERVVAVDPYSKIPELITAGDLESRCGNERNNTKLKMLSFGHEMGWSRDKQHKWHLNHYSDLSGSSSKYATPCTDSDDAIKIMAQRVAECFAHQIKEGYSHGYADRLISLARKYEVSIPPKWQEAHEAWVKADSEKKKQKAIEEINRAKAQLEAMEQS